jgi:hypothetical protein
LEYGTSHAIASQNMGRVGRSSQGCQGNVVFPNVQMLTELFDSDVGASLAPIFDMAITAVLQRNK